MAPMPSVTIAASPATVASGDTTLLTWSSSNATSCAASGSWTGTRGISGTETTAAINAGSAFTLTCTGPGGMAAATANVAVAPKPTVTLVANPQAVPGGGTATLSWTSTGATSCVATGSWSGARPTTGTEPTPAINAASSFTLTCTGPGGMGAATANVAVAPVPTVTLTANPTAVASGGRTTLTWTSTDATVCEASGAWSGSRGVNNSTGELSLPLNMASAFTLTCSGAGGDGAATVNVSIMQATTPQPTVTLTANPTTIMNGGSTTLTWSTTNATSCTASGGWSGTRATSGTETIAAITASRSYTLSCSGPGGTAAASANVAVAPRPTVTIMANPPTIASGGSTTLTWSTTNATSCTASGSWTGARDTSGNEVRSGITAASAFTLTCSGVGGTTAATANVAIAPVPTVSLTANPSSVVSGNTTTLTWSSTNATSCVASGSWTGTRGLSGTEVSTSLTAAAAFTLTCTGLGGMGAATANVTITAAPQPAPTVTISANPTTVSSGGSTVLTWSSTNATSCTASGGWSGTRATSGTATINSITANTSFTLTCVGTGGTGVGTANVTIASAAGTYQTDFNLDELPISENDRWRRAGNTFTNVRTANGTAFGTNGPANAFDDSYALLRGFGPNYTAEAVIQRSPNLNTTVTHEAELLLRFTDDAITARGYECLFSFDGNVQIIRWDGGLNQGMMNFRDITEVLPVGRSPLQTGTRIRCSISGSSISMFINDVQVARASDSTYPNGQPGIGFFTRPGGNSANLAMTSYRVTSN